MSYSGPITVSLVDLNVWHDSLTLTKWTVPSGYPFSLGVHTLYGAGV